MNTNLFDEALSVNLTENINILRRFLETHGSLKEALIDTMTKEERQHWTRFFSKAMGQKTTKELYQLFTGRQDSGKLRSKFKTCFMNGYRFRKAGNEELENFFRNVAERCFTGEGLSFKVYDDENDANYVIVELIENTQNSSRNLTAGQSLTTAISNEAQLRANILANASALLQDHETFAPYNNFTNETKGYLDNIETNLRMQYLEWEKQVCRMMLRIADVLTDHNLEQLKHCLSFITNAVQRKEFLEFTNTLNLVVKASLEPIRELGKKLRQDLEPSAGLRQSTLRSDTVVPYLQHLGSFTFNESTLMKDELFMTDQNTAKKATRTYQDQNVRLHDFGLDTEKDNEKSLKFFLLWMNYAYSMKDHLGQQR